jgi:hypothetical protein
VPFIVPKPEIGELEERPAEAMSGGVSISGEQDSGGDND